MLHSDTMKLSRIARPRVMTDSGTGYQNTFPVACDEPHPSREQPLQT
jgi:hypothetical protein